MGGCVGCVCVRTRASARCTTQVQHSPLCPLNPPPGLIILPNALAHPPYNLNQALIGGGEGAPPLRCERRLSTFSADARRLTVHTRLHIHTHTRTHGHTHAHTHTQPRTQARTLTPRARRLARPFPPKVANLPLGLGCFIVGPFGGRWADAGARYWNSSPAGRMVPGLIAAFTIFPASTLAYAWTLQAGTHLAGPLIASFFMGASICAFFPGVMSYVSILKQHAAAAAGGALQAVMFICGGIVRGHPLGEGAPFCVLGEGGRGGALVFGVWLSRIAGLRFGSLASPAPRRGSRGGACPGALHAAHACAAAPPAPSPRPPRSPLNPSPRSLLPPAPPHPSPARPLPPSLPPYPHPPRSSSS
jgi:hypothetical protein